MMFSPVAEQFDMADWLMDETPLQLCQPYSELHSSPMLTTTPSQDSEISDFSTDSTRTRTTSIASEKPLLTLTWLEEDHVHLNTRPKRKLASQLEKRAIPAVSSEPSPTASQNESHNETGCTKCRLTEVEARKCGVERRREQNRASQRKFRARKEAKIRDAVQRVTTLEVYVEFLERQNDDLEATNARVFKQLEDLRKMCEAPRDINVNSLLA